MNKEFDYTPPIHRFGPFIKFAGQGLCVTSHNHNIHHQLKHLHLGKGSVAHHHNDEEELEGRIIHNRNERHHKAPQHKKSHTKSIKPLKFKF